MTGYFVAQERADATQYGIVIVRKPFGKVPRPDMLIQQISEVAECPIHVETHVRTIATRKWLVKLRHPPLWIGSGRLPSAF